MTVAADFRLNLVAAISAELPSTQVLAGPPAENEAIEESVYLADISSTFDWRNLGNLAQNRVEQLAANVRCRVYREGPDQAQALAAAEARMDEIVSAIEAAIYPDPTITGAITFGLMESVQRNVQATDRGWNVTALVRVTGTNYP